MFTLSNNNQDKEPAKDKPKQAGPAREPNSEPNPLWQSLALNSARIQPKLAIGQPDDPYEREADHIADRVMRMPRPSSTNGKLSFTSDASFKAQRKSGPGQQEEAQKLRRKEQDSITDSTAIAPARVHDALSSPGQPLDSATRSFMEGRFGLDFAGVRIHTDAQAGASADSIHALSYTVGPDIIFGPDQYAPGTLDGRRLLAHELAHVAHQQGAQPSAPQALSIDESGERSADAAASVVLGERPGRARDFLGARVGVQRVQRQTLRLRNNHEVGVSSAGATANIKSEAVEALKRLLDLWAIDVKTFDLTVKTTWKNYGPTDVIGAADLQALKDAITKNETASLAAPVANNFLALNPPITGSVGVGGNNDVKDVTAVQTALIAHHWMTANSASGTVDAATETAIKSFKQSVAAGRFGLDPERENERVDGRDRFAGGTFKVAGNSMTVTTPATPATKTEPAKPATTVTATKSFTVYVSSKVPPNKNKVHLFFTPLPEELKFVNEQGLRSEHESSDWILIAVPGLYEHLIPNFVTISTAEIQTCLSSIQRSTTNIDAIRLSAHSRGHRGLEHTMGFGGTPLINLNLVERVSVFDASYHDLGTTLTSHTKDLTRMQDPTNKSPFAKGAVNLYDATVQNISGLTGTHIDVLGIRALSYVRFVEQGLKLGKIDKVDIQMLKNDPKKDVQGATNRLLAALQKVPRGAFSTRSTTPPGKTDLSTFISANWADLTLVDDAKDGLSKLVTSADLDLGYKFDLDPKDPNRVLSAHHWLAAELAHETVD